MSDYENLLKFPEGANCSNCEGCESYKAHPEHWKWLCGNYKKDNEYNLFNLGEEDEN